MKPYERRAVGRTEIFNLDVWSPELGCWMRNSVRTFDSASDAINAAIKPGRYRVSRVAEGEGRVELDPFIVMAPAPS